MGRGNINGFYDLIAWKKAHGLVLKIYKVLRSFPDEERYGLTSQIRRAAISIAANIAEGSQRYHFKDKARFYHQSRGSTAEVQNFLLLARDLNFIERTSCNLLFSQATEVRRLINGLIKSVNTLNS